MTGHYPIHFWPGATFPPGARFPCGIGTAGPFRHTNDPTFTTCKRCVASELVQSFLAAGETAAKLGEVGLRAWRLIP